MFIKTQASQLNKIKYKTFARQVDQTWALKIFTMTRL